ncbi:ABC transporter ATP-binding protein [Imhoffiella purpurea]|uniref:Vitamin B12 ABC transporter, ATPase component BtuD n=1 Tax=Imhoffiella purpurea TaxID=1249627 RepID=W9W376_9GAMM|nr:ABC transporter ATP-binding protein [Imhoffiella purpurea]EXJ17025.1 Vitamin B12 ABC transporter, ATPase component BtuD [Imhoffiella purpurea]
MSLLQVSGLDVVLGGKPLVRGLSFAIGEGELLGLIGPNGAGKSTVVKAIAQLLDHGGEIRFRGRPLSAMPARERASCLAYLSQEDPVQWPISVRDLVGLGRHPYRGSWWRGAGGPRKGDLEAIESAMRLTDVWRLRERRVTQLSGGERARARLARVLAVEAPLILADEPVAALDPRHQLQVMRLLRSACQSGRGVLVVLHDLTLASRFCDRLVMMDRGELIATGTPSEVLTAENLARTYGVRAVMGEHDGQGYVVPWETSEPMRS